MKKFIVNQECGSQKPQVKNGASPKSLTSRNNPLTSEKGSDTKQFFVRKAVFAVIMAMALGVGIFTACEKDSLVSNERHTAIKKQKWNPDKGYPFVLPEADMPYQYAVYEDDFSKLFNYMETIFESIKEEKGYFTLHANVDKKLIYYGFITEKSSYYDPKIFIDNPDDPFINIDEKDEGDEDEDDEIIVCYAKISTSNENKFNRWLDRQMRKGCYVEIEYNKVTGIWKGDSRNPDNWKDPYQR